MKIEEREKLGKESGEIARKHTLKEARVVGLTPRKALKRLSESLDAVENKVFYDKDRGRCVVGPDEVAHRIRLDAAKLTTSLLDMMPAEKIQFPGKDGKPQQIGGIFTDMERATRLAYLLTQAAKRKGKKCKAQPKK